MKKATKFNLILGVINIVFLMMIAFCMALRGGTDRFVEFGNNFISNSKDYFLGITSFWNGEIIPIISFVVLVILVIFAVVLMIISIVKKQGYFWEPISIIALAIYCSLVYGNYQLITDVTNPDLVEMLKCIATIAFGVGLLIYVCISSIVIIFGSAEEDEKEEETPVVEEKKEEIKPTPAPAPTMVKPEPVKVEPTPVYVQPEPVSTPVVEEKVEPVAEPTPAPVVEEKVEPVVAPIKEEAKQVAPKATPKQEVENKEAKPVFIIDENGNKVYPGRDFEDRLYEADEELLKMYSDLKNEFLSYRKVHTRVSKTNDAFRFEGQLVGKMIVSGKGLKVFLALDPLSVDSAIYHQRDASGKKKFVETPLQVKVKSPLSYRKAKQLIALAMEKVGTVKKTRYTPIDWTKPGAKEKVEA